MTASLLPLPDDPQSRYAIMVAEWPLLEQMAVTLGLSPRAAWLSKFEEYLRQDFPLSSSRDRSLTARHYAPFPLAAGHDVP